MNLTWSFSTPTPEVLNTRTIVAQAVTGTGAVLKRRVICRGYASFSDIADTIDYPDTLSANGNYPDWSNVVNLLTDDNGQIEFDCTMNGDASDVHIVMGNSDGTLAISPAVHFATDPPSIDFPGMGITKNGAHGIQFEIQDGAHVDRLTVHITGHPALDIYDPSGIHNGSNDVDTVFVGNGSPKINWIVSNASKLSAVTVTSVDCYDAGGVLLAALDCPDFTTNA